MTKAQTTLLVLLRISLGAFFLYAGLSQLFDPSWSPQGFLLGAKSFPGLYAFFASPMMLPIIAFVNKWALTLLGISLIVGSCVRLSSLLGAVLMLLYYGAQLSFPYVGGSFLVDQHVIYIFALLFISAIDAGQWWGFDGFLRKRTR